MKFIDKENLAEVLLDKNLAKNDINQMYDIIEKVASDDFNFCICSHDNGNTLQFIGVGDLFSIEYVVSSSNSVYKINDKSKLGDLEEINIYSEWGGSTFPAESIVSNEQVKDLFNSFFKINEFDVFKQEIDKLGFTLTAFSI